jgi:hypothetical protein
MLDATQQLSVRYQQIRQAVVKTLAVSGVPIMPLWLCYDPVLQDTLQLEDKVVPVRHLELPLHLKIPTAHRPGFVLLENGTDDTLFENSVTVAVQETQHDALNLESGRSVCAWLRATPEAIRRLQGMSCLTKAHEGRRWLRWHDPRVLQTLWPVLECDQQACFTQGCSAWAFIDIDGAVQNMIPFPNGVASASSVVPLESFSLRTPQWQRLAHNGLALGIVHQWREASLEAGASVQPVSAVSILSRIHGLLLQASGHGFAQTDDLRSYAMHHLQGGSLQDPQSKDRLQRALLDPGSLSFHLKALLASN